jgi:GDP-4-dehydro-6-deoxy-D-mannose reductase
VRVFVTGASGFVGRWLRRELEQTGHRVFPEARSHQGRWPDVTRPDEVLEALREAGPEAVVHLAAVSAASEAAQSPQAALSVTVGGTVNLLECLRRLTSVAAVLVVSSSEVYGAPRADELPIREDATLRPRSPYALSKIAQESVALAYAHRGGLPVVVARAFNHVGPGQRPHFVVPALAERVAMVSRREARVVPVGNLDVRRDFTDVRDVVHAYRLLVEGLAAGSLPHGGLVVNVASGQSTSIRHILEVLCAQAGLRPEFKVDPALVREEDPPEIRGDASLIGQLTGWRPELALDRTLGDIWQDVSSL